MKRLCRRTIVCLLTLALIFSGCGAEPPVPTDPTEQTLPPIDTTPPTQPEATVPETQPPAQAVTTGIDVSVYQGTIDWEAVASAGVEFAMIRVGYRTQVNGIIVDDSNARYNLQEASKYGIKLGAYFFSSAVTKEEAVEEAQWTADFISQYPITYPVALDYEGFLDPANRHCGLTGTQRTEIALAFLKTIASRGYEPMFYGARSELTDDTHWELERIREVSKIWVAQYPAVPYPETSRSDYGGAHHMWQYTAEGAVPGISQSVDLNVAYFGYEGIRNPQNGQPPEIAEPDVEALVRFWDVNEQVTAKRETNLRDIPSQGADSKVLYTLKNGEVATRIGYSDSGWSKLKLNGQIYYAVSSYLTTDLSYTPPTAPPDDGIQTVFRSVRENVTAKDVVNLRSLPSVTHADSKVVCQLNHGEVAVRTGINEDVGWSRVEYNGQTLYCVSSYLMIAE